MSLGEFSFDVGSAMVVLSDDANDIVIADAVMLITFRNSLRVIPDFIGILIPIRVVFSRVCKQAFYI